MRAGNVFIFWGKFLPPFWANPRESCVSHKAGFCLGFSKFHWARGAECRSLPMSQSLRQSSRDSHPFPQIWKKKYIWELGSMLGGGASIWSRTHSTIARYAVLCICHCFFEWVIFPPRYFPGLCMGLKSTSQLIWKPLENSCLAKASMVFFLCSSPIAHLLRVE